jgi:hypothetical protein
MNNAYYQEIIPESSFKSLITKNEYHALPNDWYIFVTDIVNSTQAINSGKYKDVNTIGVSCIIAAVNCDKDISIPFVFGGDGAFIAVPACMVKAVKGSLATLIRMSEWQYKLTLRVGVFSVEELYGRGLKLGVGKFKLSENILQACISGNGWDYAEKAIKSNQVLPILLNIKDYPNSDIDLTGFECRWKNIKARHKNKICILILACGDKQATNEQIYLKAYDKILEIYGDVGNHHPISINQLHFKKNPFQYLNEVKTKFTSRAQYYKQGFQTLFKTIMMTIIGSYLMKKNKKNEVCKLG